MAGINSQRTRFGVAWRARWCLFCCFVLCLCLQRHVNALEIVVDYKYDTNNFFDTTEKRTAIEAAAARYSRIIDSELLAIGPDYEIPCGNGTTQLCPSSWRIGFTHPGTGELYQVSTSPSADDDYISIPADEYGFAGLEANQWILYAGGRPLASAGAGGTATGANFTGTFEDPNGPLHRGAIDNDLSDTINDLPVWGGSVSFSSNQDWHFDLDQVAEPGSEAIDFYTIALHEIGHALGMSTPWNQWQQHVEGEYFSGEDTLAAYNQDNDANVSQLRLASDFDPHWQNTSEQQSFVFQGGEPNLVGTTSELQDLLLDPQANFNSQVRRLEVTNVDVASLRDIGWSTIDATNPLDLNGDTQVDAADVDLACAAGQSLDAYLTILNSTVGDVDLNGTVGFADFLAISTYFGAEGPYSLGDLTCDGEISFGDFLLVSTNFGNQAAVASVPEPSSGVWAFLLVVLGIAKHRKRNASR